jgi:glutathione S-transferase
MRLWFNPASPFARKVRVVAREAGLAGHIEYEKAAQRPSMKATAPA